MSSQRDYVRSLDHTTNDRQSESGVLADPLLASHGRALSLDGSEINYERARKVLPGGTTRVTVKRTPVPIYIERGEGPYLIDVDGNRYLDCVGNYTALIHGHAFAPVVEDLKTQLDSGACFANPTAWEIQLAELLTERVPAIDKVRFASSGTEAVLFAVKAARAYTGRERIAKLEGAYHGAYDWVEVSEASTPGNWGGTEPSSTPYYTGVPKTVLSETIVLPINDVETSAALIERHASELACVLIDVMPSRAGLMTLSPDYLRMLYDLTRQYNIVLISDEVLNFRYGYHGISAPFSLQPDIVTFGKIIGGGLPVGAIGGRDAIMAVFDSSGGPPLVPHGGTFAGNPLSMVAGLTSMKHLTRDRFDFLTALGDRARSGIKEIARHRGLPISVNGGGSTFRIHLLPEAPTTYRTAWVPPEADRLHREISDRLLVHNVMLPSDTSASCSTAMLPEDIDHFLESFDAALGEIPDFETRVRRSANERCGRDRTPALSL